MIRFETILQQFGEKGDKTGWTYIQVPQDLAEQLQPGSRKTFRVKGKIDAFAIKGVALMPMRDGSFMLPVNAAMRKGIHKKKGAMVVVSISVDKTPPAIPPALKECLDDEPKAMEFFQQLTLSNRNYFIKWIEGVKNEMAQAKRIAQTIDALLLKQNFVDMMRAHKAQKQKDKGF
ncbi:MAG TPA: hypothetical protein DHW64_06215 [Chitinophagaceae bacterium]|nr:hypothetical protein [Chitinophagaceae bacterium]